MSSSVAAGPFLSVAALLAVAGVAKLARPEATASALRAAGFPAGPAVGRVVGAVEVAVAGLAIVTGSRPAALVVAATFVAFAAFTIRLMARQGVGVDCGCFGEAGVPASTFHVGLDLGAAALAGWAAIAPPGAIGPLLADQPLGGVPLLALVAVCTWLGHVAYTLLPELRAVSSDGGESRSGRDRSQEAR